MTAARRAILTRASTSCDSWYLVEWADHDGRMWMEPSEYGARLMSSARMSDADVEGDRDEIAAMSLGVLTGHEIGFRRCAVRPAGDDFEFWSPRNSTRPGLVAGDDARAWADATLAMLGAAGTP